MTRNFGFFVSLTIFYILILFSPNKIIYFGAYFAVTGLFYILYRNIRISLLYSLILSFFSDIGLASSWFVMEPREWNMGSGWMVTPLTILVLCLTSISLREKISKIYLSDIIVILYLAWNIIVFLVYPYFNVILGIISLAEIVLAYSLIRLYISEENKPTIFKLLLCMLIFQSVLGIMQMILKHPVGILAESVTVSVPFGYTASENDLLFRLSGTFPHPNVLATFLISFLPLLATIIYKNKPYLFIIPFMIISAVIFTYTRIAWMVLLLYGLVWVGIQRLLREGQRVSKRLVFLTFILILFIMPFISERINTIPQAFEESGSFGIRVKLFQEGMSIVSQSPIFGTGLNRSPEVYFTSPVTDILSYIKPSSFYRIHNTFLEIAAESGITGLIIFLIFLLSVINYYFISGKNISNKMALIGLGGLILISMFNPSLHYSPFRYFFLLSAIILA